MTSTLKPLHLEIRDDSHKHAGHASMRGSDKKETHFYVHIVSEQFKDKLPIERHRLVNQILAAELNESVHAL